jgi:hypothetical protein
LHRMPRGGGEDTPVPVAGGHRCWWLAVDFDGPDALPDALMHVKAARALQVPVAVEVSRSGVGAHAWAFSTSPVPWSSMFISRLRACWVTRVPVWWR